MTTIESRVRDLVDRGATRQPELRSRLEKAAFILLFRTVSPELDGTWSVSSEQDAARSYTVDLNSDGAFCTCQDSVRHPGAECKHSLATVMLSRALLGLEKHRVFDLDPVESAAPVRPVDSAVYQLTDRARRELEGNDWETWNHRVLDHVQNDRPNGGRMPRAERED